MEYLDEIERIGLQKSLAIRGEGEETVAMGARQFEYCGSESKRG